MDWCVCSIYAEKTQGLATNTSKRTALECPKAGKSVNLYWQHPSEQTLSPQDEMTPEPLSRGRSSGAGVLPEFLYKCVVSSKALSAAHSAEGSTRLTAAFKSARNTYRFWGVMQKYFLNPVFLSITSKRCDVSQVLNHRSAAPVGCLLETYAMSERAILRIAIPNSTTFRCRLPIRK